MLQTFRAIVIGTLNIVAVLVFIGVIIIGVLAGLNAGSDLGAQYGLPELPGPAWGVIGGLVAWLAASVVLGFLFVLLDIQDGIRDLNRVMTRQS